MKIYTLSSNMSKMHKMLIVLKNVFEHLAIYNWVYSNYRRPRVLSHHFEMCFRLFCFPCWLVYWVLYWIVGNFVIFLVSVSQCLLTLGGCLTTQPLTSEDDSAGVGILQTV
jgi:hypothetical protein